MVLILAISLIILCIIFFAMADISWENSDKYFMVSVISFILWIIVILYGTFNGFINYPPTQGSHQGVLTAVDLEGVYFRHYRVYLKSNAYTEQGDETEYCIYLEEQDLADELQNNLGKKVKLNYSHKGGYIGWKSCGTYHIDSVELLEEE